MCEPKQPDNKKVRERCWVRIYIYGAEEVAWRGERQQRGFAARLVVAMLAI